MILLRANPFPILICAPSRRGIFFQPDPWLASDVIGTYPWLLSATATRLVSATLMPRFPGLSLRSNPGFVSQPLRSYSSLIPHHFETAHGVSPYVAFIAQRDSLARVIRRSLGPTSNVEEINAGAAHSSIVYVAIRRPGRQSDCSAHRDVACTSILSGGKVR